MFGKSPPPNGFQFFVYVVSWGKFVLRDLPVKILIYDIRIVDETTDMPGAVLIEDGIIREALPRSGENQFGGRGLETFLDAGASLIGGRARGSGGELPVLMPALVELHAHFRDPGFAEKETLESASLAAAAGGYGTVVCMANTRPVIDSPEAAAALRRRAAALALIDLYPALSLTRGMEGRELSGIAGLPSPGASPGPGPGPYVPRLLSEDGKDVAEDPLFLAALGEARRLGIPVSCHCDAGGPEAEEAKQAGKPRRVWSRIEENNAVRRAIGLGKKAGCHIHIAHVSTKEAVELVRQAKGELKAESAAGRSGPSFTLSCEAAPHHIACTEEDARRMGDESYGRVNPPLREEADRRALAAGVLDGTIDAIATDHAPHGEADKAAGAPGFTGLETGFAASVTALVREGGLTLSRLSSLMSAAPARILGLGGGGTGDRGRIAPGLRADLILADPAAVWRVEPESFKSRGKNSPFAGRELRGRVLMTIHRGRVVFEA
jgi:dihydroorotase